METETMSTQAASIAELLSILWTQWHDESDPELAQYTAEQMRGALLVADMLRLLPELRGTVAYVNAVAASGYIDTGE